MECISSEKLYCYLDGELPESEEQKIETHLLSCRKCFSLAKRLEFESAVVAKALRSKKVSRESRERTIRKLAEKRGWKLKKPFLFKYSSFSTSSQKIVAIFVVLLGMFAMSNFVLTKDAYVEVGDSFMVRSGVFSVVKTDLPRASRIVSIASSIIGGTLPSAITIVFLVLYTCFAGALFFLLSTSVPVFEVIWSIVDSRSKN